MQSKNCTGGRCQETKKPKKKPTPTDQALSDKKPKQTHQSLSKKKPTPTHQPMSENKPTQTSTDQHKDIHNEYDALVAQYTLPIFNAMDQPEYSIGKFYLYDMKQLVNFIIIRPTIKLDILVRMVRVVTMCQLHASPTTIMHCY